MMQQAAMAKLEGDMAKNAAQVTDIQAGAALKAKKAEREHFELEVDAARVGAALGSLA
jgi:hypothetical protein